MEVITIVLAANELKQFRKAGSSLEITDSVYPVTISMYSALGSQTNSLQNVLSGHFLKARFGAFDIKNGPVAQVITILALDEGEDGGSRRQPGNVRVIDQSTDKTLAGGQFFGSQGRAAAAGFGGIAGVKAGSKNVAIKKLTVWSSLAGVFQIYFGTGAPLTGLVTGIFQNKMSYAANATAISISGNCAAANPTVSDLPGAIVVVAYSLSANQPYDVPLTTPIVLTPNNSMVISSNALNRDIFMAAELEES